MRRTRRLVLAREALRDLTPRDLVDVGTAAAADAVTDLQRTLQNPFTCTYISQAVEPCPLSDMFCTRGC
jgi:hypothetical protein